jgi:oligopeptidase A
MENPLLEKKFNVPFDKIKPEHVVPAVDHLLKDANNQLKDLINSQPTKRTFENTVLAYEAITEGLGYTYNIVSHLKTVDNNEDIVEAFNKITPKIIEFSSGLSKNSGLYSVLKEYAQTEEAKQLQGARKRFLTQTMDDFRRSGAELDKTRKKRLSEIDVGLAKLGSQFGQNLLNATNAYTLMIKDENRLSGLPEREKETAKERARKKGKKGWLFNLQMPSVVPVLQYADDRELRKELYLAYSTLASTGEHDNRGLIVKMLDLRKEKAQLLAYDNFADLVLEDRMAKNGNTAIEFLNTIKSKIETHFQRENQELEQFYKETTGLEDSLQPWDVGYFSEKLRKARFDFDSEELRPYFSFENTLAGLFDLVNQLYGITIEETDDIQPWKGDGVKTYQVLDEDGTHLGSFLTDYFPREEKRGGAWMNDLYQGGPTEDGFQPHLALNCGNLTPPVGDKPSLLSLNEVDTIFHEFGHLLHQILSTTEIRSQSGPSVAWDFVELPSQIMENWVKEKEVLNTFAKHYETGEAIPEELLEKMKNAETYRKANFRMRQLSLGLIDFQLHTCFDSKKDGDVVEYCRNFMQQFAPAKLPEGYSSITAFQHLFGSPVGYACGYYSYQWAEVLDADAFGKFKEEGLFNRETGMEFRNKILAKGDSKDPAELYKDFMGRDPDSDAVLKRDGLL